jgi:hypothetical protein
MNLTLLWTLKVDLAQEKNYACNAILAIFRWLHYLGNFRKFRVLHNITRKNTSAGSGVSCAEVLVNSPAVEFLLLSMYSTVKLLK